jgi:LacI family transcriptional regulator
LAAEHLLASGRRRLAFVTDTLELHQITERFQGAMAAVAEQPDASLEVISCPERSVAGGEKAARLLLQRPRASRPDGVFCVNDLVALGLCDGLRRAVSVPDDLAIVGYDDIEFARLGAVPLTSVRTPQEAMGVAVADLLLAQIAPTQHGTQPESPLQVELEPELVVRTSTSGREPS